MQKKKIVRTVISALITTVLLIYVFSKINFISVVEMLKSVNVFYYILALLLYLFGVVISSIRWKILLSALKINVSFTKLFSLYLVGIFFNFFMPSRMGGDVVKMYYISKYDTNKIKPVTSVFMDRFSGLFALITITTIALIFGYKFLDTNLAFALAFILVTVFCSFFMVFNKRLVKKFEFIYNPILRLFNFINLRKKVEEFYETFLSYKTEKKSLFKSIILSFIFHLSGPIIFFSFLLAVGLNAPLLYLFLVVPIVSVLTMLPISIYGFGVREAAYIYFLAIVGISASQTMSILVLGYSITVISILCGGAIHLTMPLQDRYMKSP